MDSLPAIFLGSFVIGLSGAMMPGPMLTVLVREAPRRGFWAGPLMVLGHGLLELALVAALVLGLASVFRSRLFMGVVGVLGGAMLIFMAGGMLRGIRTLELVLQAGEGGERRHPAAAVLDGVLTSVSNPYFTVWWATVGLGYLTLTAGQGLAGTAAFIVGHVMSDLVWFSLVALAMHLGRRFISDRLYRWLVGVCAVVLVGFGLYFGWSGVNALFGS